MIVAETGTTWAAPGQHEQNAHRGRQRPSASPSAGQRVSQQSSGCTAAPHASIRTPSLAVAGEADTLAGAPNRAARPSMRSRMKAIRIIYTKPGSVTGAGLIQE